MKRSTSIHVLFAIAAGVMIGCTGTKQTTTIEPTGSTGTTKGSYVVGFSQIGAESAWRTANTSPIPITETIAISTPELTGFFIYLEPSHQVPQ